jgi:glycosyltransferase involved in cell wall biosynthesis
MLLSVIIPSYNHSRYIRKTLEGLRFFWNGNDAEIIIVDDGSTDDTINVINSIITELNICNFQLHVQKNAGVVAALNKGVSLSKGTYLYFVASDDVPDGGKIKLLLAQLQNEGYDLAIGGGYIINDDGVVIKNDLYNGSHAIYLKEYLKYDQFRKLVYFPQPLLIQSSVFSSKLIADLGGFDSSLPIDDYPLFCRIFLSNAKALFRNDLKVISYRQHATNSSKKIFNQVNGIKMIHEKLAKDTFTKQVADVVNIFTIFLPALRSFRNIKGIINSLKGYSVRNVFRGFNIYLLLTWRRKFS